MTPFVPQRDERIDLRVSAEVKNLLARAASLAGMSVSGFMVSVAAERAREILTDHESLTLSPRDWEVFLAALDRDQPPDPQLKAAAQRYLHGRVSHGE